jgi:hypothetical protein
MKIYITFCSVSDIFSPLYASILLQRNVNSLILINGYIILNAGNNDRINKPLLGQSSVK